MHDLALVDLGEGRLVVGDDLAVDLEQEPVGPLDHLGLGILDHRLHRADSMSAARKGTREIVLAVLATSLSLVVIFVPVAFMGGIVGRFFRSFGLTVAFAVLMSLFVSFTLTPMLCATSSSSIRKRNTGNRSPAGFIG